MNRQAYRVVLVYTDKYVDEINALRFGAAPVPGWRVHNTYRTRAGARGQATCFINLRRGLMPGSTRFKSVRVEQWVDGNWEVLDERDID